jgi:hypothetical protein
MMMNEMGSVETKSVPTRKYLQPGSKSGTTLLKGHPLSIRPTDNIVDGKLAALSGLYRRGASNVLAGATPPGIDTHTELAHRVLENTTTTFVATIFFFFATHTGVCARLFLDLDDMCISRTLRSFAIVEMLSTKKKRNH